MPNETPYWFPAKLHGWGWGPPATWQGWVVLVLYILLLLGGAFYLLPRSGNAAFVLYAFAVTALLIAVCWVTGEPPGWR